MFDEDYDDDPRSRNSDSAWIIGVAFYILVLAIVANVLWRIAT